MTRRPSASSVAGLLVGVLAASAMLFTKLAMDVSGGEPIVSFDRATAVWLHVHATGSVTDVLAAVTRLGAAVVLLPVTLAAALALLLRRRWAHAALMGAALVGGEALNMALKAAFERPRPSFSHPLATATGFSFPSGHAMVALTVYGALAFVVSASVKSRRARASVVAAAVALVLAIGFSRVYLGVHYVSDVLAAYSVALAWLMLCGLTLLVASATAGSAARRTSSAASS